MTHPRVFSVFRTIFRCDLWLRSITSGFSDVLYCVQGSGVQRFQPSQSYGGQAGFRGSGVNSERWTQNVEPRTLNPERWTLNGEHWTCERLQKERCLWKRLLNLFYLDHYEKKQRSFLLIRFYWASKVRHRYLKFWGGNEFPLTWCNWPWSTIELFPRIQQSIRATGSLCFPRNLLCLRIGRTSDSSYFPFINGYFSDERRSPRVSALDVLKYASVENPCLSRHSPFLRATADAALRLRQGFAARVLIKKISHLCIGN